VAARVVLADDHPLFLQALQVAMERAGFEIAGTAMRGDDLLELMARVEADVVLLDLAMPGYDGFECIHRLRASHPNAAIVVVSGADDEASIRHAMEAGAVCFVGKAADPNDLAGAIRVLLNDAIHLTPRAPSAAPEPTPEPGDVNADALLTRRELEILRLVSSGLSNAQMAKHLWVTEQTIKFHLSNVYRKIGIRNRTAASRWAQANGLLEDANEADANEA
jgi:DNA-binding NarL/FixJ family response regulator